MASQTQWTWICVNSGSWWWTGRPGMLWFMGSQWVGHEWATELTEGRDLEKLKEIVRDRETWQVAVHVVATSWRRDRLLLLLQSHFSRVRLWDPRDCPPGSPIPGILQARTLEWVAISFSNAWKWEVKGKSLRQVRLFTTSWAYQAPPPTGFSRQEYWSGLPSPSPVFLGFPGGQVVKDPPAMWETWILSLSWWDSLEEGLATPLVFLSEESPRTEEPGGLPSMGL